MVKLDETGLELATCRHVLAKKAINMFRGEVFGYPYFFNKESMTLGFVLQMSCTSDDANANVTNQARI